VIKSTAIRGKHHVAESIQILQMKIVADSNIPLLDKTFGNHGQIKRLDGRNISRSDLSNADVLLVRSVSQVDHKLLKETPVKFVGSATIGTDHLELKWLKNQGIKWASAPGCNADAAAQYTLAMMSLACERLGRNLYDQQIGIIGKGNVGSRLKLLLDALRISNLAYDPPLSDAGQKGLVDLKQVLEQDIVSLHVPLTQSGPYPTDRMIKEQCLRMMKDNGILLNCSRGRVIDEDALITRLQSGHIHAVLDVWQNEPAVNPNLVNACIVASPHVAGYSLEGKQNGTLEIYKAFCDWQGLSVQAKMEVDQKPLVADVSHEEDVIQQLLKLCCTVEKDDQDMRALAKLPHKERAPAFDALRKSYRIRRDFRCWQIKGASVEVRDLLNCLGFQ
jgi:erythronate-4-phosphate dehydrogenase